MVQPLEKVVDRVGKEHYRVSLCNPYIMYGESDGTFRFHEEFVSHFAELFKIKDREQEVLDFYANSEHRLFAEEGYNIFKKDDDYYHFIRDSSFCNRDKSRYMRVEEFCKMDIDGFKPIAVSNLVGVVHDSNISLGDKKLIKDVALAAFLDILEMAVTPAGRGYDINKCVRVERHRPAIYQLRNYGFKIGDERFVDVDLRNP